VVTFYVVSALGLLSANPLAELVVATMLPKGLTVILYLQVSLGSLGFRLLSFRASPTKFIQRC
jgi:hypothetical protein